MRLLKRSNAGEISFTKDLADKDLPKYAILSHTWGDDEEEVTYGDVLAGIATSKAGVGSAKMRFCIEQTKRDGLEHFWSDTCCIDKTSSAELSEALNSMFRWYEKAAKCYAYLADVHASPTDAVKEWEHDFRNSRWFTRGWTLQELIAPSVVEFYSSSGVRLGDKSSLEMLVHASTGIPVKALRGYSPVDFTISERQEWKHGRQTGKPEDMVYSLLGLLEVTLPVIYGIGEEEVQRKLDLEIAIKHKGVHHAKFALNFELSGVLETPNFVARTTELSQIRTKLLGNGSRRYVVLHGLGGIGKTQLAIAYAVRHRADYSAMFWLDATTENSIKSSFVRMARQILQKYPSAASLVGLDLQQDLDAVVHGVHIWLNSDMNNRWLLMYDNYDNPKVPENTDPAALDIQTYLPVSHQGSVIITTRSSQVQLGNCIRLEKFKEVQDSLDILRNSSGKIISIDDNEAIKLATRLDGLPLALATAGAYLHQTSTTFAEYINLFDHSWAELHLLAPSLMTYENRTLFSTWQISFEQVQRRNSISANLLRLWAYFEQPRPMWFQELVGSKLRLDATVRVLSDHGLVDAIANNEFGVESGGYSVHACVHSWMMAVLNKENAPQLAEIAVNCVALHIPDISVRNWSLIQRRLLNHADRSVGFVGAIDKGSNINYAYHKFGSLYANQGKQDKAEEMYMRALRGYEKALGADHTSTLSTVNNLGVLYADQGKLGEAEKMYLRALEGREKALGADHTSTITTVICLCRLRIDQRRIREAGVLYERARCLYSNLNPSLQGYVDRLRQSLADAQTPTTKMESTLKTLFKRR